MDETGLSGEARQRAWRRLLLGALLAVLAPGMAALGTQGVARAAGCRPGGSERCAPFGIDLGDALRVTLDLAWGFVSTAPLILLAIGVGLIAVRFGFSARWHRLLLGSALVLFMPLAALAFPLAAVVAGGHAGCVINEGGLGECVIYGVEMGFAYHAAAIAPWLVFLYLPAGILAGLVFVGFEMLAGRHRVEGAEPGAVRRKRERTAPPAAALSHDTRNEDA